MKRRAMLALPLVGAVTQAAAAIGGLPTKTAHEDSSPEWEQLYEPMNVTLSHTTTFACM